MADSQAITTRDQNGNLARRRDDGRNQPQPPVVEHNDKTEHLPAEEDIHRTREQISQTTTLIQQQLRANMDWKLWVYRYPLAFTALAAASGVVVGFAIPSGGSSRRDSGRDRRGDDAQMSKRDEQLIKQTGTSALLATVLTNVATTALREGAQYLARRVFDDNRTRR